MKKSYIILTLIIIAIGAAYFINRINSSLIQDRVIALNPISGDIRPPTDTTTKDATTKKSTNKKSTSTSKTTIVTNSTDYRLPKLTTNQKNTKKEGRNPYNSAVQLSNIDTSSAKTTANFSDSDDDGLSDIIETQYGTDSTNADSDKDGISDSAEVLDFNTDPMQATVLDTTPGINNLNETTTGGSPIIKGNAKTGETITIVAKNLSTNEIIEVCESETDEQGKFFCFPENELEDGDYYLYSNHKPEKGKTTDDRKVVLIKVDHSKAEKAPDAEIQEVPDMIIVLSDTQSVLNMLIKFFGENFAEKSFRPPLEKLLASKNQTTKLIGKANPGEVIVATWKSVILSSTVIADASQGNFEMSIPSQLSSGQHDIFVYAFNPKLNLISNITKLKFFKS